MPDEWFADEYDVVIIGAGSSGSVIAARASEEPNHSVLLLEAGPDYPLIGETPFDLVNSYRNSTVDHDWGHAYQPTAEGRSTAFPRGRVTGGSSAVTRPRCGGCPRITITGRSWAMSSGRGTAYCHSSIASNPI